MMDPRSKSEAKHHSLMTDVYIKKIKYTVPFIPHCGVGQLIELESLWTKVIRQAGGQLIVPRRTSNFNVRLR